MKPSGYRTSKKPSWIIGLGSLHVKAHKPDLRHDPIAMIGSDFPVVVMAPPGKVRSDMNALIQYLGEQGAELSLVGDCKVEMGRASTSFLVP